MQCTCALSSALSIRFGDLLCSLLRCVPSSMPTRHKGIGMSRPKKKTPQEVEPSPMDTGDAPPAEKPPPPPPPEPEPAPAEPAPSKARDELDQKWRASVVKAKKEMYLAEHDVRKFTKKWLKVKQTYIDSGKYSYFAEPSVVERIKMERLWTADRNLGEAKAAYVHKRTRWTRLRTYRNLRKALDASFDSDDWDETKRLLLLKDVAFARLQQHRRDPKPSWESMWPGLKRDIWEWNQQQYGLALTWGLTHYDIVNDPQIPEGMTEAEYAERRAVNQVAYEDKCFREFIKRNVDRGSHSIVHGWWKQHTKLPHADAEEIAREMGMCCLNNPPSESACECRGGPSRRCDD